MVDGPPNGRIRERLVRCVVATCAILSLLSTSSGAVAQSDVRGTITVSAAASLRDAFTEIGKAFRVRYPEAKVRFNFGSSATLVTQISAGAPVDVAAFADRATMDRLVSLGLLVTAPTVVARNSMMIAVKKGNPLKVSSVADLNRVGVVAMCVATAPCGAYAKSVLTRAGVSIPESRITRGTDVRAVVTQVSSGDAQAALVYVTDVLASASSVSGVAIPRSLNVTVAYPIAVVKGSKNGPTASAFVAFVSSAQSRAILKRWGFLSP